RRRHRQGRHRGRDAGRPLRRRLHAPQARGRLARDRHRGRGREPRQELPLAVRRGRREGLVPGAARSPAREGRVRQGGVLMLSVFRKDLRIFFRDRTALVFSLVMPILVITVIAEGLFFDQEDGSSLLVPVVNEDQGPVATTFVKLLGEH